MNKRDLKRLAKQAYNDLDRALFNLQELHRLFDDGQHEDHVAHLTVLSQALIVAQKSIEDFWRDAWGEPPDNIPDYAG